MTLWVMVRTEHPGGPSKFNNVKNASREGILPNDKEILSVTKHEQESKSRPEKDIAGSYHSCWKEGGISSPT